MNVEIKNYPSARTLVAEICGDIDHHTAKYFRGEIDKAIRSHNPLTLILDYSQVTFMDSSGIGLVMGRYKIMSEMDGEVIVASPPAYIRKVLQLAGIHRLTKIVTDIAPGLSFQFYHSPLFCHRGFHSVPDPLSSLVYTGQYP